jgi:hypothetical protein
MHREETKRKKCYFAGIIQPSSSPWNSPVLVIPAKADASCTRKRYNCGFEKSCRCARLAMVPHIHQKFLGKSKFLSTIGYANGFLQVPVRLEDRAKVAFRTIKGRFQYKRMLFSFWVFPATFQRLTTFVSGIQGMKYFFYLGDVQVFGGNLNVHDETSGKFLQTEKVQHKITTRQMWIPEKGSLMFTTSNRTNYRNTWRKANRSCEILPQVKNYPRIQRFLWLSRILQENYPEV